MRAVHRIEWKRRVHVGELCRKKKVWQRHYIHRIAAFVVCYGWHSRPSRDKVETSLLCGLQHCFLAPIDRMILHLKSSTLLGLIGIVFVPPANKEFRPQLHVSLATTVLQLTRNGRNPLHRQGSVEQTSLYEPTV